MTKRKITLSKMKDKDIGKEKSPSAIKRLEKFLATMEKIEKPPRSREVSFFGEWETSSVCLDRIEEENPLEAE